MISDKSFHVLVQSIKDEEIPYFFQYSSPQESDQQNSKKQLYENSIKEMKNKKKTSNSTKTAKTTQSLKT